MARKDTGAAKVLMPSDLRPTQRLPTWRASAREKDAELLEHVTANR